jgi:hypothetical protein
LEHNELRAIHNNLFNTSQGTGHDQRVGDRVYAKALTVKMYFENQQYRPRADYLVMVIRNKNSPSSNITSGENIFEGVSSSKNIDFIDYNKYDILYSKRITVSNAGSYPGSAAAMNNGSVDGTVTGAADHLVNAARYHTFKIKLGKSMAYLDGSTEPSFQRYALACIPYANYSSSTSGGTYPVGHVSAVFTFSFKDP